MATVSARIIERNAAHTRMRFWINGQMSGDLIFTTSEISEEFKAFQRFLFKHDGLSIPSSDDISNDNGGN